MESRVRLLMEEIGCDQGEAELALELADNDLEKAIRTIASILRHIVALKGKFYFPAKNLYGLLHIVVNTKTQEILRMHTVVSYNPALFENSAEMDWYAYEKLIFSYRLDEGSLPDFTQDFEEKIKFHLLSRKEALAKCDPQEISALLAAFFTPDTVTVTLVAEELNLDQFRRLPGADFTQSARVPAQESEPGAVFLQVDILEDKSGKSAESLVEGDLVLSQITDERDIAHYLAHLIGGRREGAMIPLPAVVRKVTEAEAECEVQIYYAPRILGIARVKKDVKVKLLETKAQPWWKKIITWNM